MPKKKSPHSVRIRNSTAEFLTFAYQTGGDGVEVRVEDGTIWLSQKNMGLFFETTQENVMMHLKNIFSGKELAEDSVAKVFLATAADGKNYRIKHYNLDAIIAVGWMLIGRQVRTGIGGIIDFLAIAPDGSLELRTLKRPLMLRRLI